MMDRSKMRLNEMAVAIGAPMNPRRIGSGPQTNDIQESTNLPIKKSGDLTKGVVKYGIDWCYNEDNASWNGK